MRSLKLLKAEYWLVLLLVFTLLICCPPQAHALELTAEEQTWIEDNPTIYLGSDYAWPPYDFIDASGQHSGISADFMALISEKTGLNIQVRSGVWSEVMAQMKAGELDGLACAMKTPERESFLHFSTPYTRMPLAVVVQSDRSDIRTFDDLKGHTIAVNKGSYLHEWFSTHHPDHQLYLTTSNSDSLDAVSFSQADAYVGNVGVTTYLINEKYLTNLKIVDKLDELQTETSVAIDINQPILASIIQKALDAVTPEERKRVNQYWFNASRAQLIDLSPDEQAWIRAHPVVNAGGLKDWAPYDFINADQRYSGIIADYLALISRRTGLKFETTLDEWDINLHRLQDKQLDLLPGAYKTAEREAYALFSDAYFDILDYFFVHRDLKLETLADLAGKTVAIPKGYAQAERIRQHFPEIKVLEVASFSASIDAVLQGKAQLLYDGYPAVAYALAKQGITDIVPFRSTRGQGLNTLHMMTRDDYPQLASIIQKALNSISQAEKQAIYQTWVQGFILEELNAVDLVLTPEERRWLVSNRQIRFTGLPQSMPFEMNRNGHHVGIVAEYLKQVEASIPVNFTYLPADNASQMMEIAVQQQVEVVSSFQGDDRLAQDYRATAPYATAPVVVLMKQQAFVNELGDIADAHIALVEGSGYVQQLKTEYPDAKFVRARNATQALMMLEKGTVQATVLPMPQARYLLKTQNVHSINIVGKTHVNQALALYVNKSRPALYSLLDKTLSHIDQTQGPVISAKWSKLEFAKQTDYWLIVQVVTVLLVIMGVVFYWNLKLAREIRRRQQLESELRQSQAQLQVVIDNVPLRILVTAPSGDVLSANAVVLRDFGITAEDARRKNIADYYVNDNERAAVKEQLAREGKVEQKVVSMREANGSVSNMMLSVIPIEYNHQPAFLSLSLDLSERIEMEQQLQRAKEQAEAANAAKSEFLANMSHEIRTPMNAILGFTELLREQVTEPRLQDFTRIIQNAGNSLLRLINDILDLSKIEAGKMELSHSACNLHEMLREIADIFTMNVSKKGIQLYLSTDDSIPDALLLDATRLRQVIFNLIGNAVKFTERGHVRLAALAINHDEARSKIDLVIRVEDTGMGIAPDQLKTIFDSFGQQFGQDNEKYGGTGLGLSISQRLVSLMGGQIDVASEQGQGTTFTVTLKEVDIASVQAQKALNASLAFDCSQVRFHPATVLVVDDVEDNRALLVQNFADSPLTAYTAADGLAALSQLEQHEIDLVIMDIRMPGMDGYDCAEHVKQRWPELPVIALTASVMQDEFQQLKQANFDAYLRKPVLKGDLFQTLMQFLAHDLEAHDVAIEAGGVSLRAQDLQPYVSQLKQHAFMLFQQSRKSNNMDTITEFAKAVADVAVAGQAQALDRYATLLLDAVDSFNIMAIKALMTEFESAWADLP